MAGVFLRFITFSIVLSLSTVIHAECGLDWYPNYPVTSGNNMTSIAYSPELNRYVAVGESGTIVSSTDLINWQRHIVGDSYHFTKVIWAGDRFVVIGNTWGDAVPKDSLYYSLNGIDWVLAKTGGETAESGLNMIDIVWTGNKIIAIGQYWNERGQDDYFFVSKDAIEWDVLVPEDVITEYEDPRYGFTTSQLSGFEHILWDGKQATVLAGGYIFRSEDGYQWEWMSSSCDNCSVFAWDGEFYYLLSEAYSSYDNYTGFVSSDLKEWTEMSMPEQAGSSIVGSSCGISNGESMVFCMLESIYHYDQNNVWNKVNLPTAEHVKRPNTLNDVIWDGNQYVGLRHTGNIVVSPDGINWTYKKQDYTNDIVGMVYGNDRFVAASRLGVFQVSTDGVHWDFIESGYTGLYNIFFAKGRFFAVPWCEDITNCVDDGVDFLVSSDGYQWDKIESEYNVPGSTMAESPFGLVVTGSNSEYVYFSENGESWERIETPIYSNSTSDVYWGNGQFWLDGYLNRFMQNRAILTSTDGKEWQILYQENTDTIPSYGYYWNGYEFIGMNSSNTDDYGVYRSTDGLAWNHEVVEQENDFNRSLTGAAWLNNSWYVYGLNSEILKENNGGWHRAMDYEKGNRLARGDIKALAYDGKGLMVAAVSNGGILSSNCTADSTNSDGSDDGDTDGSDDGDVDGSLDGNDDGASDGENDGSADGDDETPDQQTDGESGGGGGALGILLLGILLAGSRFRKRKSY